MKYKLLFLGLFSVVATYAQQKTLNLDVKNKTVSEIFSMISSQTGFVFSYDASEVDEKEKKTLKVEKKELNKVLDQLLLPTYEYSFAGKYIILRKTPKNKVVSEEIEPINIVGKNNTPIASLPTRDSIVLIKKINPASGMPLVVCRSSKVRKETDGVIPEFNPQSNESDVSKQINNNKKEESMFKKYVWSVVLAFTSTLPYQPAMANPEEPKESKPAQVSFIYPLSTDGVKSIDYSYNISFNILGGVTGGINGAEFAGIFNFTEGSVQGFQGAGIFNKAKYGVNGAQFAGILNMSGGESNFQAAGIFNMSQAAIFQGSSIFNLTQRSAIFQVAGIANSSRQGMSKVQIAGVMNNADTAKVQLAGVVNIAKSSNFQLGLVNIRDTADGVSLGLINIAKKGGILSPGVEADEFMNMGVSFRSGVRKLYSIVSFGYNFSNNLMVMGAGLGTTFSLQPKWDLNLEFMSHTLVKGGNREFNKKYHGIQQATPLFTYHLHKHCKIFAGPSFNLLHTRKVEGGDFSISAPYSILDFTSGDNRYEGWIGFKAGVRF